MLAAGPVPCSWSEGPLRTCVVITGGGSCLHDLGECRASLCPQSTEGHGGHTARAHLGDAPSAICVSQASVSHGNDPAQWLVCDAGCSPAPVIRVSDSSFLSSASLERICPSPAESSCMLPTFSGERRGRVAESVPMKGSRHLTPIPLPVLQVNALQSWLCRCCQGSQPLSVSYSVF